MLFLSCRDARIQRKCLCKAFAGAMTPGPMVWISKFRTGNKNVAMSRRGLVVALLLVGMQHVMVAEALGWAVVQHDGREYVTATDIREFYRFPEYNRNGNKISFRTQGLWMDLQVGSQDLIINSVKFIMSFPCVEKEGKVLVSRVDLTKLIDPVLRPNYIRNAPAFDTVVLDAGHGGHDLGARGPNGNEKDFALATALRVRRILEERGFRVVMTRSDDTFISLQGRSAIANKHPRAIFVSIHFNHADRSAARGIETFALTPEGAASTLDRWGETNLNKRTGNQRDAENIALATAVHGAVLRRVKATSPIDRGIKRARFSVISGIQIPGILFEGGFVGNPEESRLLSSPAYQQMLAEGIAQGVITYRRAIAR